MQVREYDRTTDGAYDFEDMGVVLSASRIERAIRLLAPQDVRSRDALSAVAECEALKRKVCSGVMSHDAFLANCRKVELRFRDSHRVWKYQVPVVRNFYEIV